MGHHKSISLALGASHHINPALGILKEFMYNRAMLIPEISPNHSLTKFVLNGEVYRMTLFLLLCLNYQHVVSSIFIISVL